MNQISTSSRLLLLAAGLLFIANLLIANDILPIFLSVEIANLESVSTGPQDIFLPHYIWYAIYKIKGLQQFWLRLPGVLLLLTSLVSFYFLGRKIFGKELVIAALLVMCSSLLIVNISKFATTDALLFSFQLINFAFLLLYLKQPILSSKLGWWLSCLFGCLLAPGLMLIWAGGWWLYLYKVHPRKGQLKEWYIWPLLLLLLWFSWSKGWTALADPTFILGRGNVGHLEFIAICLLGLLPWLGFLPAALLDLFYKLRKGEELAILTAGWLVLGLLCHALIFEAALAFIIGRQLLAYFQSNYPYGNWLKTGNIILLIIAFFAASGLMMGGYTNFGAQGFRMAMAISAVYWMGSLIGVIGIFGMNKQLLYGGFACGGLLMSIAFWVQMGHFLQQLEAGWSLWKWLG